MNEVEELRREVGRLHQQLADAQQALDAMARGEVDAVAARTDGDPVLLRQAQQRLRRSEKLLRSVFDSALDSLFLFDDELRFVDANPAACELLGVEREQVLGRPLAEFISDDVDLHVQFRELISQGRLHGQYPLLRGDGTQRLAEINTVPSVAPGLHFGAARDVTRRVEAQEALLRSETRFRTLIEKSTDGISVIDAEGVVLFVSESAGRILGRDTAAIVGRRFEEFVHPDDRERLLGEHAGLASGGPENYVQFRVLRADGAVRWLEGCGRPMLDDPGIRGVVGNFRDITERKLLEDEREGFFRLSLDLFCIADHDGYLRRVNPAWTATLGWSSEELCAVPWVEFLHPDDRERSRDRQRPAQGGRALNFFENRYRCKDGSYRRLQWTATPSDHTDVIYAVARDITEQREMEDTLRRSERRYRRIVDNTSEGLLMYDASGSVTFMNPSMARMLGCSVTEGMGRSVFSFVHEEMRDAARARLEPGHEPTHREREELRMVRADGGDLWVSMHVDMLRDEAGDFESALAMVTDITAWRESREALQRSEEQLRQAQKMEAIGSLAGGVAHDFNNLLSVILSYTSLMLNDLPAGDPVRNDVEQVHRAGTRATELTRQLLAFSRKQVLQPVALDVNQVLVGLEQLLSRTLGEHITVRLVTGNDVGNVFADQGQIEQVVMNLSVNARDAMPEGGTLTLETSRVVLDEEFAQARPGLQPGAHVLLTVSDTGTGMDAETRQRIFEPFFTTKDVGKGTGLGLSTVYGIVKQSGGYIWAYSELGKGTTFKIYLPRTDRAASTTSSSERARENLRGSETVLLVEDEAQVRAIAAEILQRNGYEVLRAQNPGEALLLCEQHPAPIHLLLSDVVMPQLNGPQLAHRLTAMRPDMRVLFMSGYTEDAVLQNGVLDGELAFLPKPVLPTALLKKVREVLEGLGA